MNIQTTKRWLAGVAMAICGTALANGPDVNGIMGQINNNYSQAIRDVPSVSFSNSDGRERDRLRGLQSRDANKMQETLNQYGSGGQNQNSGGQKGCGKGSTGGAFYECLRYREDDPFLFCTDGQDKEKAPKRCWWPIAPFTGAFMMNPACRPPNPYGYDWSDEDWDSLGQYLRVCPMAGGKSGTWNSKSGKQPNMVPFKH